MWLRQARGGPCLPLHREVEAGRNDAERLDVILAAGDDRADVEDDRLHPSGNRARGYPELASSSARRVSTRARCLR
jgi:hypothetical protein